jgi:hypothetical protein
MPFAAWLRNKNVLGYEPRPQILNEPKSLYQSPSGSSGCLVIQTRSWFRSASADGPFVHAVDEVLTDISGQIVPALDPGH